MTIELDATSVTGTDHPAADALRGLLGGRVHLPGDPGYDAARTPWNFAVDQRPAAVALPRTAAEVGAVVRVATEAGLRVAPQSTGHNAGPLAAQGLDDVVVVRMSEMGTAIADPIRGIVRVEGGALWEPAVDAAAAHGQAVLHGLPVDRGRVHGRLPERAALDPDDPAGRVGDHGVHRAGAYDDHVVEALRGQRAGVVAGALRGDAQAHLRGDADHGAHLGGGVGAGDRGGALVDGDVPGQSCCVVAGVAG